MVEPTATLVNFPGTFRVVGTVAMVCASAGSLLDSVVATADVNPVLATSAVKVKTPPDGVPAVTGSVPALMALAKPTAISFGVVLAALKLKATPLRVTVNLSPTSTVPATVMVSTWANDDAVTRLPPGTSPGTFAVGVAVAMVCASAGSLLDSVVATADVNAVPATSAVRVKIPPPGTPAVTGSAPALMALARPMATLFADVSAAVKLKAVPLMVTVNLSPASTVPATVILSTWAVAPTFRSNFSQSAASVRVSLLKVKFSRFESRVVETWTLEPSKVDWKSLRLVRPKSTG